MSVVLEIVLGLVVLLVLAAVILRLRKLRRDEMRDIAARVDPRLMEPPPSPYATSKGFRLLDGPINTTSRPEPPRPRLEPDREYVFSESQLPNYQEPVIPLGRHDERWALAKSDQRARFSSVGSRLGLLVVVLLVLAVIVFHYVEGGRHPSTTTTTTTTTSTTTTLASSQKSNTSVQWPSSLVASSTSGDDAAYDVPVARYRVTVTGARGAVWTVYEMGVQNTLEWQGRLGLGSSESLVLSGPSRITLGSPSSATVTVGPSPVTFPSPLPPTLNLIFTPAVTQTG